MTGNGKHTTYWWWWLGDGFNYCFNHIMVLDNGYITVFMFCWIIKHGPSGWYDHKTATTMDQPVYSAWSWLIVVNNGDSWPRWWCSWDLPFGNLQNPRTTGGGENHRQKCWKFSVATFDDRRIQWSNQAFKMALKMAADLFFPKLDGFWYCWYWHWWVWAWRWTH